MPEFCSEIDPFLVSVRIPGGTFEQSVEARKRPIQQRNQIVFEIDLQSYVLVVLAAACFKCLPNLIVQFVCLTLSDGIVAIFVDQQCVHDRNKKARIVQHLGDRLSVASGVLHDDPCFSGQFLQKAGQFP